MAVGEEERAHVRDLFAALGDVQVRRMFGGAGVYLGDACFALILDGGIWMRGDPSLGLDYEAAGSERWFYGGRRGAPVAMPYWRLPDTALDDPDEAAGWARRSLVPAERAAAEKQAAARRRLQNGASRRRKTGA